MNYYRMERTTKMLRPTRKIVMTNTEFIKEKNEGSEEKSPSKISMHEII